METRKKMSVNEMQPLTKDESGLLTGGFIDATPEDIIVSLTSPNGSCTNVNCNSNAKNKHECSNTNCTIKCSCNSPHYGQIGNSGC